MPPAAETADAMPLAAIDLGSNSFRLELGQLGGPGRSRYKRIDYLKETVRLGGGLDAEGRLTEDTQLRGLACLARFAQRLHGLDGRHVRAVATQTLREARNRDAFLHRARLVLGHPIEVISGREEARLIFAGVARLQPSDRPRLVIDIGGRSTEMILGQGRTPRATESFQVGSVSLSMRFFPEGRFSAEAFRAAQIAAGAELEEALQPFAPGQWIEALGASGTVGAVSQLLLANGVTDGAITPAGLRWCIEACLAAGDQDALDLPGLKPERRAVLGGGLSILYTLAMQFGIDALHPARGALRQGVIFDLGERLEAAAEVPARRRAVHDMRDATVQELQRRFGSDPAQAERARRGRATARPAPARRAMPTRCASWAGPPRCTRSACRCRTTTTTGTAPTCWRTSMPRASRRASSGASPTWCSATVAACASSTPCSATRPRCGRCSACGWQPC